MFNEVNCGEKLDILINKELETETFPGIEILYAKGSEVLLHKTWGKMQSGNSSPLLLDTIFDVASLTKPVVTATLLLIMQEILFFVTKGTIVYCYLTTMAGD